MVMEVGEEDPFGSLVKLCQITPSQESRLENCPFARESEDFPDAVDSLPSQFSPNPTPSEPPGIVMVSPPETDSEDEDDDEASMDKSTPQEYEEFQTPPEHHNRSISSSQEDAQKLRKPSAAVDVEIEGSDDVKTVPIDDGCGGNESNFDLMVRGENLGFLETEKLERKIEVIEGFESELKKFRDFEGELGEPSSKKIRVSEEIWGSETQGETENTEKVGDGDDNDDDEDEELIYLDVDDIDEGIGIDQDNIVINVDSADKESEANDGVSENGEMQKKSKGIADGENDNEGETEKVYCGHDGGVEGEDHGGLDGGENSERINGAGKGHEEGIKEYGNDEVCGNGEEVSRCRSIWKIEKFWYKGTGGIANPREEEGIGFKSGENSLLKNEDLGFEASEKVIRNNGNDEVQKSSEKVLVYRNIEEIERFRYEGSRDGGDQCRKEVVGGRRELPLSLREKGNDFGGKERVSKVNVKNLSWKELLDGVAVVLGNVNEGSEDVDFLEAAKRKGMTFPQPRWI